MIALLLAAGMTAAWPQAATSPSPAPLEVGFSLDFFSVRTPAGPADKAPLTRPEDNILLHEADPGAAARLEKLLRTMKDQGAGAMREHVWFRHAEDTAYHPRHDPLGLLVATGGKLPQEEVDHLVAIAGLAKRIGYRRFVVVLGIEGSANPKAKKKTYGDAYDSRFDDLTWSVTRQVVEATQSLAGPGFDLVYDIAPGNLPEQHDVPGGPNLPEVSAEDGVALSCAVSRRSLHHELRRGPRGAGHSRDGITGGALPAAGVPAGGAGCAHL